ncbi:formyl transferase [Syncephalis fuscata]|nr:formyl transferase [Syncephalis fuscata]
MNTYTLICASRRDTATYGLASTYKFLYSKLTPCSITTRLLSTRPARIPPSNGYRILFFGTDHFSLPSLMALHKSYVAIDDYRVNTLEVVTLPERRVGRGMHAYSVPVKAYVDACQLPVHYPPPVTLRDWKVPLAKDGCPFDLAIVVSFGYFLPASLLKTFHWGGLNVHPSLLPRYRGAAPIQHAILDGIDETGVTVQELDPHKFDAGRILLSERVPMPLNANYRQLEELLAEKGANLLLESLKDLPTLKDHSMIQDVSQVTKAPKLDRQAAIVDWTNQTAIYLTRLHRAIGEKTPLVTQFRNKSIQLRGEISATTASPIDHHLDLPGTVVFTTAPDIIYVKCAEGWLCCTHVQVANKRMISIREWINGYNLRSGEVTFNKMA